MNSDRKIGRIVSVNTYSAVVELDQEALSFVKNSYEGTHKVGIINSYIIIPIGADKIVGMVNSVQMVEESELNYKSSATLILPKSRRTMKVTMIGSIVIDKNKKSKFEYGISGYPALENEVWSITETDLDIIFRKNEKNKNNLFEIGRSTIFPDYAVMLDMDNFFGKHAAILGNTGSGKSCTVTAIIRSILGKKPEMKNAHFIIFDTNNEYESAFTEYNEHQKIKKIWGNRIVIKKEVEKSKSFVLPHWFMNSQDYFSIFRPGEGAQAPILYSAINVAKSTSNPVQSKSHLYSDIISSVSIIKGTLSNPPTGGPGYYAKKNIAQQATSIKTLLAEKILVLQRLNLVSFKDNLDTELTKIEALYITDGVMDARFISSVRDILDSIEQIVEAERGNLSHIPTANIGIDTPKYFNFKELVRVFLPLCLSRYEQENQDNRIRGFLGTLQIRLEQFLNDPRYSFIFQNDDFEKSLASFLRYIFGESPSENENTPWYSNYNENLEKIGLNKGEKYRHNTTIIDFSNIASDVLENTTALVGRLIFEFMQRISTRGSFPLVIVLEEAHHYIPEHIQNERQLRARQVFERIAKEGRKFGLSLMIASQRPSELSRTVLAQCNSFIVHRIQNPEDQLYFRSVVSSISHDLLNQLPALPQRTALVLGDCVTAPIQVTIQEISPVPDSKDPKFSKEWTRDDFIPPDFEGIADEWESGN